MKTSIRVAAVALLLLVTSSVVTWSTTTPAAAAPPTSIDAYLDDVMAATGLPGLSVAVTHDGEVVYTGGRGHESTGATITEQTPMRMASVSKMFTTAAVLTLVDDGTIELDAAVRDHLPQFDLDDPRADRITVRQLLNQTSGLSDGSVDIAAAEDATDLAGYVDELTDGHLYADPGTSWRYSNVNANVAARLVEVVSSQDFGTYLDRAVLSPLGMESTVTDERDTDIADGYNSLFGWWIQRDEIDHLQPNGSGALISTADDMAAWLAGISDDRLLSAEARQAMFTPSGVTDYALGWGAHTDADGGTYYAHSGNLFTAYSVAAFSPDTGYGYAVMTNGAGITDDTFAIMTGLMELTSGETPAVPGGERQTFEAVLAVICLAAIVLTVLGVRRAGRWARKMHDRPAWRTGLRLLPILLPVAVLAGYRFAIAYLMNGRHVTWEQLTYFGLPLLVTVTVCAAAGAAVAITRVWRLRRLSSVRDFADAS